MKGWVCISQVTLTNVTWSTLYHWMFVNSNNLNIWKWHTYYHGCHGRKLQQKNYIFTNRKIDEEELLLTIA